MASKELRLPASSSSSDSSTEDEDRDTSMDEAQQSSPVDEEPQHSPMEELSPKSMPPKMRIKLSFRMPKSPEKDKLTSPASDDTAQITSEKDESATPVNLKSINEDGAADATTQTKGENGATSNDNAGADTVKEKGNVQATKSSGKEGNDTEVEEVVQATVVDSSDEGNTNDAEPVVVKVEPVEQGKRLALLKAAAAARSSSTTKKRTSSKPSLPMSSRTVRMPPLSSPGMLIPPSAGVFRGSADANGYSTPASVFDHCMSLAGYTTEARTKNPHRGSSVKREVGDMFDSDVTFALNFPSLVPKEMWSLPKDEEATSMSPDKEVAKKEEDSPTISVDDKKEEASQRDAAQLLLRSLTPSEPAKDQDQLATISSENSRKRRRPWQFSEMVPLSLTLPYPESYIQKRLRYTEEVQERERAIVASQEANQKFEDAQERYILLSNSKRSTDTELSPPVRPEPIEIPPIPEPVTPPRLSEMEGAAFDALDDSNHPIYVPKTHDKYTAHLDPACFHITNGRYFNIMSNSIADPTFVGPNAPGIANLNLAGGSGLATAYAGSTNTGSAAALKQEYYESLHRGNATPGNKRANSTGSKISSKKKSSSTDAASKSPADSSGPTDALYSGPTPTSTSTALKRLMDEGDDAAQEMKNAIIRAAVYASRTDNATMSFCGSNGEIYPDVSKAFAAHAGVRPCSRCKNNKQGAYHCRLRRKHKDLDYDGGNSPAALAPLFQEPLDDLLLGRS